MSETTEKEAEDERMASVETERELRQRIHTEAADLHCLMSLPKRILSLGCEELRDWHQSMTCH